MDFIFAYKGSDYVKVAILVDGGFYRKRSSKTFGHKTAKERAQELYSYCNRHLKDRHFNIEIHNELYRLFYYDCPPIDKQVFHPALQKNINFSRSETKQWTLDFFNEISQKRKVALRLGELNENSVHYNLKHEVTKKLMNGTKSINELTPNDFALSMQQKGVDMRIGLDIAALSYKHQVDKIVLIAGDSDFVPAAKLARREGIDFVLDSLGLDIRGSLSLHIDGRRTCDNAYFENKH